MSNDIERLITTVDSAIRRRPDYPYHLVGLAEIVVQKKYPLRGAELARRAMAEGGNDPATTARARRLLTSLIPGYHLPMMNDARRNAAWDSALRRTIRPGMQVLEIGTGAGMLALMAARAGAEKVITCEANPVVAAMARELAARNGYADRVEVIDKRSEKLVVGIELERPADLLFCDIFGDRLLDFDPLPALADARKRLLMKDAPVVPARGILRVALAHWKDYRRMSHIDTSGGFDLASFADFAGRAIAIEIGDPAIRLMSGAQDIFHFDFSAPSHPPTGRSEVSCEATTAGEANGVARWIRLELDDQIALEARPEQGASFFSRLHFCPLPQPLQLRIGERLDVGTAYRGELVETWLAASK